MSHTNHTHYYELPQYVGSDIINPLVDTNGAYETIDETMHNIASEAAQNTADVATLQSKVGSGVFDTTAQNATDAVNEIVGELNTADTGIKARLTTAENDVETLQGQMVTAQGNIVALQNNKADTSDISSLNAEIDTINSDITKLKNNRHFAGMTRIKVDPVSGETYQQMLTRLTAKVQETIDNLGDSELIVTAVAGGDGYEGASKIDFEHLIDNTKVAANINFEGHFATTGANNLTVEDIRFGNQYRLRRVTINDTPSLTVKDMLSETVSTSSAYIDCLVFNKTE